MKVIAIIHSILALTVTASNLRAGESGSRNELKYTPEALADEITDMPGLDYDINFRQFSGYLHLKNTTKYIFYWYTESQRDPANDPVAYWTNVRFCFLLTLCKFNFV